MKMKYTYCLVLILISLLSYSQNRALNENNFIVTHNPSGKINADTCIYTMAASCNLITDTVFDLRLLESRCYKMNAPPYVAPAPNPLCAHGGAPSNLSWIAFQAGQGDYSIELDIFSCVGGLDAAQFGFIKMNDCDFSLKEEILCIGLVCVTGRQYVESSWLIPGEIYYLFVDGCQSSVCDIKLKVFGDYAPFVNGGDKNSVLNIGGSVWSTFNGSIPKVQQDKGGARVQLYLRDSTNAIIDSTITTDDGNYLFSNLSEGLYEIEIPEINFLEGKSLYKLESCFESFPNVTVDNNDNGFGQGKLITSKLLNFRYNNSNADTITNTTIDFCLVGSCRNFNPGSFSSINQITDTICDLNSMEILCTKMDTVVAPENNQIKFCSESIQAYNTNYLPFMAGEGDYEILIKLFSCIGGINGAEVILKRASTKEDVFCSGPHLTESIRISSNYLIPGQVYYLIINGSSGSSCTYDVVIEGNYRKVSYSDLSISEGLSVYCLGDTTEIHLNNNYNIFEAIFEWQIFDSNAILINELTTTTGVVKIKFFGVGKYTVKLNKVFSNCLEGQYTPLEKEIVVENDSTCNKLNIKIKEIKNITCNEDGFIIYEIENNVNPFTVYLDSILQTNTDTIFIKKKGFYKLKIIDANNFERTVGFWIGSNSQEVGHDFSVSLVCQPFVRGRQNKGWIIVENYGCKNEDVVITLERLNHNTSKTELVNALPFPNFSDDKILRWNLFDIGNKAIIPIEFSTSVFNPLGTELIFKLSAENISDDLNQADNVKEYQFVVFGSFDPNDKNASPQGKCKEHYITKDQVIDYTIRFQNTGTSSAKQVYIIDTLSIELDLNTFNVVTASHNYYIEEVRNDVLSINFPDIDLPAQSEDSTGSNGYIVFSIKPKSDTPYNTLLTNKSAIYFDLNEPIITNEVFHTIVDEIPIESSQEFYNNCISNFVEINGQLYDKDTIFTTTYLSQNLCDSVVYYHIEINEIKFIEQFHELCFGDSIIIGERVIVMDSLIVTEVGCDTIIYDYVDVLNEQLLAIYGNGFNLSTDGGYFEYKWIDCDDESKIVTTTDSTFIPGYNGNFRVEIQQGSCSISSDCIGYIVGVDDLKQHHQLIIYPNPSNDKISIKGDFSENTSCIISLFHNDGKKIKTVTAFPPSISINIEDISDGVYYIMVQTNKGTQIGRFVKI